MKIDVYYSLKTVLVDKKALNSFFSRTSNFEDQVVHHSIQSFKMFFTMRDCKISEQFFSDFLQIVKNFLRELKIGVHFCPISFIQLNANTQNICPDQKQHKFLTVALKLASLIATILMLGPVLIIKNKSL